MSKRSESGVLAAVLALVLIGALVAGGLYFMRARQALVAAKVAEANARQEAEHARAEVMSAALNVGGASYPDDESITTAVEAVFRTQEDAWNRGDVEAFMEHYWKSDDLTFSSGGKTTRGWNATLARYRERYPTRDQMGRLTLSDLEITPLGDSAALILGQWKLDRDKEPVGGNYSIIMRKFGDRWLIVHDHTSRLAE
jgi:uncharacterized protein (TIGR02246 family)